MSSSSRSASDASLEASLVAVAGIPSVATILEVIVRTTGLGFAAVVRVTDVAWLACAVRDEIDFGVRVGDRLDVSTTICRDAATGGRPLASDDAAIDGAFCDHPAPRRYGFRSFVAAPLTLPGGEPFGTLFACGREPRRVNTPETLATFALFGELIGQHLDGERRRLADRATRDSLAERESRLRSVIASAKDYAIVSVDAAGQIDGWNSGAAATFGWTEAEAVGRPFDLIWTPEDVADGSPGRELRTAEANGSCPDNRAHVRADGRRISVVGSCRPVRNASGELAGFVKVCRDDSERRAGEQALSDALRRNESALLAGEVGTFNWDVGVDRLYGDANFARMFGLSDDGTGAFPLADYLAAIRPDDRPDVEREIQRTLDEGDTIEIEYRILHAGGERAVVARGKVERDADGRPVRFPGVIVDITERQTATAALRASEAESRFLVELGEATRRTADPDAVLALTVERLRRQLDVARCAYAEVDADEDGIIVRYDAAAADTASVAGRFRLADFGVAMLAELRAGRTVAVADVTSDPRVEVGGAAMAAVGVAAVVNVPLVKDGRLVAVLAVHESHPRNWTADEVRLIEAIAERSWAEIERAQAGRALARSMASQSYLVRLSDALRPLSDPGDVRAAACGVLGEHLGVGRVSYFEIEGDDYVIERDFAADGIRSLNGRQRMAAFGQGIVDRLMAGATVIEPDAPATLAKSDAERATFADWSIGALVTVPLVKDGKFVAGLTIHAPTPRAWTADEVWLIEQTAERTWAAIERAHAERATRESEARLRQMADAMPQFVWTALPDGTVDFWNRQWYEHTGLPRESTTGDASWRPAFPVDDGDRIAQLWYDAVNTGQPYEAEYLLRRHDGQMRWSLARADAVRNAEGRITRWYGTITDIHDQRLAAEAARADAGRLAAALSVADLGTYDWDLRADAVAVDARGREMFAFDPATPLSSEDFFGRMDPADLGRVKAEVQAGSEARRPTAIEYDVRLPGGTVRRIGSHGRFVYEDDGRPTRMYGVFADLTDRRRAERAVAESEARLRAMVQATTNATYRVSADWSTLHELNGGTFIRDTKQPDRAWMTAYVPPEHHAALNSEIDDAIAEKRMYDVEHPVYRTDGTMGWASSRAVPLLGADGEIVEWFGVAADITERKRAEAERERFVHDLAVSEQRRRMAAEAAGIGSFNIVLATAAFETDVQFNRLFAASEEPIY